MHSSERRAGAESARPSRIGFLENDPIHARASAIDPSSTGDTKTETVRLERSATVGRSVALTAFCDAFAAAEETRPRSLRIGVRFFLVAHARVLFTPMR